MTLAQTRELVHQEIEALQDERATVDVQIAVHNKDLVLLMERSQNLTQTIDKLSGIIPVLRDLEEIKQQIQTILKVTLMMRLIHMIIIVKMSIYI